MKIIENEDGSYIRQWRCGCGRKVETDSYSGGHDVECSCGQWFNCFGQRLQDPNQWHEDY